jgi:hypothetical protein
MVSTAGPGRGRARAVRLQKKNGPRRRTIATTEDRPRLLETTGND